MVVASFGCGGQDERLPARACEERQGVGNIRVNPKQSLEPGALQAIAGQLKKRAEKAFGEAEVCFADRGLEVWLAEGADRLRAARVLATRGRLEFRPVKNAYPPRTAGWMKTPSCAASPETLPERTGAKIFCVRGTTGERAPLPGDQWTKLELAEPALGNADVAGADPVLDASARTWLITLRLTEAGGTRFATITGLLACNPAGAVTRQLAIVVDGIVESHPQVGQDVACRQGIQANTAQIAGGFSEQEAKDLAAILSGGVLPAEVELG